MNKNENRIKDFFIKIKKPGDIRKFVEKKLKVGYSVNTDGYYCDKIFDKKVVKKYINLEFLKGRNVKCENIIINFIDCDLIACQEYKTGEHFEIVLPKGYKIFDSDKHFNYFNFLNEDYFYKNENYRIFDVEKDSLINYLEVMDKVCFDNKNKFIWGKIKNSKFYYLNLNGVLNIRNERGIKIKKIESYI